MSILGKFHPNLGTKNEKDVAAVDDEGVLHGLFHHAEARHAELFPFGDGLQKQPHLVAVLLGGLDEGLHILGPFRLMRVASMEFAAYLIISALGMSVKITRKLLSIIGR